MPSYRRDRLTRFLFVCLVAFGVPIAALGPAVPSLRADLGISLTVAGFHFTALALGSVVIGLIGSRVVGRIGRTRVLQLGLAGLVLGPLGLVFGWSAPWTIASTFGFGLGANLVFLVVNGALSDHHGEARSTALAEANVVTGVAFMVPGLLIGGLLSAGASWRLVFAVPVVLSLLLLRPASKRVLPVAAPSEDDEGGRFLPGFRAAVAALTLSVAIEWSIAGWAAEHLVGVGTPGAVAAVGATIFYAAVTAGRAAVVPLTRRFTDGTLLAVAVGLTAFGALTFWLGSTTGWVLAGIVVSGLGISSHFPLLASVMFAKAPGRTDTAGARINLVGGLAVVVAPVTLGAWADASGLRVALSGVVLLVVVLAAVLWIALRAEKAPAGRLRT